jgi:hypothetical protein
MTDAYVRPAIATDRSAVAADIYERISELAPGTVIEPTHPAGVLVEGFADWIAQNLEQGSEVGDYIFRRLGTWLYGYAAREATQATALTTWTFTDSAQYLIEAGTPLTLLAADGSRVNFQVRTDVLKAAGLFSTGVGEVEIIATDPGADGTGLSTGAQLERPLISIGTITLVAPTAGGEDAEGETEYLDRLKAYLGNRQDTLVLPRNFEVDAVIATPQLDRALALNGYNPGSGTFGNAGFIAVAVINAAGADPGGTIRTAGQARQQAMSIAGLTVNWIAATYTTLTVVFSAKAFAEYDPADVEARAEAALADYISPANWGLPPFGDQRRWLDKPIVRIRELVTVLENVEGLDFTLAPTGTATTTSGNPNLTVVNPTTAGWVNGMAISGAGIPAGTLIGSGAGTATMGMVNAAGSPVNATASAAGVAITGAAVTLNGGTADVAMTGPAALPAPAPTSTVNGTVS